MTGVRPFFLAFTNSLTTFQSCVLAWAISPSMLLLVSSNRAIWTVGDGDDLGVSAGVCDGTTRPDSRHADIIAKRFIGSSLDQGFQV
jgi:hypothetical protein